MSKEVKKEEAKTLSNKEVIENLKTQLKDSREKYEYFKTKAIKAEGAIEVGDQMHPKEVDES